MIVRALLDVIKALYLLPSLIGFSLLRSSSMPLLFTLLILCYFHLTFPFRNHQSVTSWQINYVATKPALGFAWLVLSFFSWHPSVIELHVLSCRHLLHRHMLCTTPHCMAIETTLLAKQVPTFIACLDNTQKLILLHKIIVTPWKNRNNYLLLCLHHENLINYFPPWI